MSKESVWAHLASIQCILKIESETYEVIASLEEFEKNVNGFDKEEAIKIFNMIGVKRIETEIFVKKSA
jgi:hypothetical protein